MLESEFGVLNLVNKFI